MVAPSPQWEVHHGDALDVMRSMREASIDAVVMDPPYCSGAISEAARVAAPGQGLRSETIKRFGWFTGDNMGTAGLMFLLRSIAFESVRVVKPTGSLLVFCDWRMLPNIAPAIESAGVRYQGLIVWDKGAMGMGNGFRCQHEMILHFTLGSPEFHDAGTPNVLNAKRVGIADRQHQTEKPVELMERLIGVVCPPGGTVLDPMCGSGTTLVAAVNTGRVGIGVERGAENVEIARARITRATSIGNLFA